MTSEILIINQNAIALAADSTVTVSNESTYDGVNKLFMLSNDPPMGMMIYGNAHFMNIPMETLINEYKIKTDFKNSNSVNKIMNEFLRFLEKSYKKHAKVENTPQFDFDTFKEKMIIEIKENKNYLITDLSLIDNKISDEFLKELEKRNFFKDHENLFEELSRKLNANEIKNKNKAFKKRFISELPYTGVVIAGFNEENLFPSFCEYAIYFVFNNKILFQKREEEINIREPMIKPFAQRDVIDNFLFGMDLNIIETIEIFFRNVLRNYGNSIQNIIEEDEKIEEDDMNIIKEDIEIIMGHNEEIISKFETLIKTIIAEYTYPILRNITALPKEELGNMCESLINITSLKRKVSGGLRTVGGDTDVAIISKGDGFIWLNKKQYFNMESNPQYLNGNYKKY